MSEKNPERKNIPPGAILGAALIVGAAGSAAPAIGKEVSEMISPPSMFSDRTIPPEGNKTETALPDSEVVAVSLDGNEQRLIRPK